MSTEPERVPIWSFGVASIGIATSLYVLGFINLEVAFLFSLFFGLPTWFVGLIWFGIKSDELLGVEHAYGYEVSKTDNSSK